MIEGVKTKRLRVIPDERGRLMEILRADEELFQQFGQAYITTTYPQVVKAWHYHKIQTDNIAVVKGMLKLALYDPREGSPTKGEVNEFYIGEHNPLLVQVPKEVCHGWMCVSELVQVPKEVCHGWMCVSEEESIAINIPTEAYRYDDPDEYRIHPHDNDIPYDWERKDG
jgi:dTDP-4-dehydrorhamnose 3,5-epimerase